MLSLKNKSKIRVLLIQSHNLVRNGLKTLIAASDQNIVVVADAADCQTAIRIAAEKPPDVILLGLPSDCEANLKAIADLRQAAPNVKVVILAGEENAHVLPRAVQLGAVGIVRYSDSGESLCRAVNKVYAGEVWLDRTLTARVLSNLTDTNNASDDWQTQKIKTLTPREREIVQLVGEGLKNKDIGNRLFISEATVRHHLTSVFSKLEVEDRLSLAIYAYQHSLAQVPKFRELGNQSTFNKC